MGNSAETVEKPLQNIALDAMVAMAVEGWRFSRLFIRMMNKLDAADTGRYVNNLNYYLEKLNENLQQVGMKIVNVEGQPYDTGMAATALNVADFAAEDHLMVDQMLEPIIMGKDGLIRSGTVMLRKAEI